ncbi:MAG TPA: hypothetical protein VNZ64_25525 [Candidatus Acidoferrum sp.]|nr:hypothetical protein [Candidatus Acidoferrum sp.]
MNSRWSKLIGIAVAWLLLGRPGLAQPWIQTSAPSTNWSPMAASADGLKVVACVSGDGV